MRILHLNSQGESEESERSEADEEVETSHEEQPWLSSHEPVPPPDNKQIIFSQSDLLFYSTPTSETDLESLRVEWHLIFVLERTDLLASHHTEFSPCSNWYEKYYHKHFDFYHKFFPWLKFEALWVWISKLIKNSTKLSLWTDVSFWKKNKWKAHGYVVIG